MRSVSNTVGQTMPNTAAAVIAQSFDVNGMYIPSTEIKGTAVIDRSVITREGVRTSFPRELSLGDYVVEVVYDYTKDDEETVTKLFPVEMVEGEIVVSSEPIKWENYNTKLFYLSLDVTKEVIKEYK